MNTILHTRTILKQLINISVISLILVLTFAPLAFSQENWIAQVFSLEGSANVKSISTQTESPAEKNQKLFEGDQITVSDMGRVGIEFKDGHFIRLSAGSKLTVQGKDMALNQGRLHFFNRSPDSNVSITTSIVSAAVRGTELIVTSYNDTSTVSVLEGAVLASNQYGAVDLSDKEMATVQKGKAPQKSLIIAPEELSQWVVSVPILSTKEELNDTKLSAEDRKKLDQSIESLASGNIEAGIKKLRNISAGAKNSSVVSAYELLFALSEGKKDNAKSIADNLQNNSTASAILARSYYLQSEGQLETALKEIQQAYSINPSNTLVLARLAELNLYFGNISSAKDNIKKACGDICSDPYLKTIQGFIYLVEQKTDKAQATFNDAISQAPSLSQAYIGLGLSQTQAGNLLDAKTSFQRAIAIDPTVASYRNYLGKLAFENDDLQNAYREFEEGLRLDPTDPTPNLYRAFAKMADNNPIGAIEDIETSIEKNDNRAVYRSRMLLDQDSAARSAALSRAFRETGFTDAARVEAIRSLNEDPLNYSSYRLLGESYDEFFYADTALSELRKARLLAPVGLNLQLTSGSNLSLNNYDTLFEGSRQRSGVSYSFDGRQEAHIPSVTTVGKEKDIAWQLSAISALANGSRRLRDTEATGAFEYQIDWDKKLRFEGLGRFVSNKDRFSLEEGNVDTTAGSAYLSYVQKFDSNQAFIADIGVERVLDKLRSRATERTVGLDVIFDGELFLSDEDTLLLDQLINEKTNLYRAALQYIYNGERISWVIGTQSLHQTPDRSEESTILEDSMGIFTGGDSTLSNSSTTHLTGHDTYVYATSKLTNDLNLTTGIVRTDIQADLTEVAPYLDQKASEGRFNPKVGLTYEPVKHTLLRTSYTETLRKSSLEDQISLEPSFVSGIPQRYNDFSGTIAKDTGIGIDWKDPGSTYLGAEYVYRRVQSPFWSINETLELNADTGSGSYQITNDGKENYRNDQHLIRGYVNQKLNSSTALSLTYRRTQDAATGATDTENISDDTVAATLRWFDSSGIFAYLEESWRHQSRTERFGFDNGNESAWLTNVGIGYRLPNRNGRILLEGLNLFNEKFGFDQTTGFNQFIKPSSEVRFTFEYNF